MAAHPYLLAAAAAAIALSMLGVGMLVGLRLVTRRPNVSSVEAAELSDIHEIGRWLFAFDCLTASTAVVFALLAVALP